MTGFGRGEARFKNGKVTIEIKTVNHKFFDETIRLPAGMASFEDRIKEVLQKRIRRGKINMGLVYDGKIFKNERITINHKTAKSYCSELSKLNKRLGLNGDVSIREIIALPGVISYETLESNLSAMWPRVKEALELAIDRVLADREKEGRSIYDDLSKRAKHIEKMLGVIKARAGLNIEEYRKRFAERVRDISGGREIDRGRLEMEVAIYAKNSDISEEINRIANHLSHLNKTISGTGEVGKKVDFIAQELHREINTTGSKASDFKIAQNVIDIKGEIEKIREQAKNLE
jgi:uncharacterized protein (TIGR00255 family)